MDEEPTVIVVDDDVDIREALVGLLRSVGLKAKALASVSEFLEHGRPTGPACLVLDVRLPGRSGLDLQRELAKSNIFVPIIFVTGYGDIPMTVQAMKAGAVDFLTKPVRDQTLLDAVSAGVAIDAAQRAKARVARLHIDRWKTLTRRERQVMGAVALGRLNKQIAYDLAISEVTVKLHRSNVMHKMQLHSVGELVRVWEALPAETREGVEA